MKINGNNDIPDCKVVLIGDSGVGKSSIISRYIGGIFVDSIDSTISSSFSQKEYEANGKKVRLNIWDTAGQEKFRSIGRNFYKDAYIILMVYDITNKQSFEDLKSVWFPEIQQFGEKYKIIAIVGNKSDRYEEENVSESELNSFSKELGGTNFLVSAKNGNGIELMFKILAEMFLNPNFQDTIENRESFRERVASVRLEDAIDKKTNFLKCC